MNAKEFQLKKVKKNPIINVPDLMEQYADHKTKELQKEVERLDSLLSKSIKYGYEIGVEQQKVVNDSNVLLWKNALLTKTNKDER